MEELQSWWEVPTIAHFCSLFRAAFNLLDFSIEDLEDALLKDGTEEGSPLLRDLLVRLLSGCYQRRDINLENHEKYLKDFVKHRYCKDRGEQEDILEDTTFQNLTLRQKVDVLHYICDCRLDAPDVADVLKDLESDGLRLLPLGEDDNGSIYWYFYGTRLYKEDPLPEKGSKTKEKEKAAKKKEKAKKLQRRERKRKRGRRGRGKAAEPEPEDSDNSEDEPEEKVPKKETNNWSVVCCTEEDWNGFAEKFQKSKSRCEKDLYRTVKLDFVPEIGNIIAEREKLLRKRLLEIAPRRASQRIEKLRQIRKEEVDDDYIWDRDDESSTPPPQEKNRIKPYAEDEEEHERQKENRAKERHMMKEERAKRAQLRAERAELVAQGKDIPPHLHHNSLNKRTNRIRGANSKYSEEEEEWCVGLQQVLDDMQKHPDAWPFEEPVDERYAAGYYDIVKNPMDLATMEQKLHGQLYQSVEEFQADFNLMIDNCRKYNGIDSDYTRMADNLKTAFSRSFLKHVENRQKSDNEFTSEGDTTNDSRYSNDDNKTQSSKTSTTPKVQPRPVQMQPFKLLAQASQQLLQETKANNLLNKSTWPSSQSGAPSTSASVILAKMKKDLNMQLKSPLKLQVTTNELTAVKPKLTYARIVPKPEPGTTQQPSPNPVKKDEGKRKITLTLTGNQKLTSADFTKIYQASLLKQNNKPEPNSTTIASGINIPMNQNMILLKTTSGSTIAIPSNAIQVNASSNSAASLPTIAIPVKKRAYHGLNSGNEAGPKTNTPTNSPVKVSEVSNVTQPPKATTVALQPVNGNIVKTKDVNSVTSSEAELLNSQRKSVISVPTGVKTGTIISPEGLIGKLQSNGKDSVIIGNSYVQLPRGASPAADSFARTMSISQAQVTGGTPTITTANLVQPQQIIMSQPQQQQRILVSSNANNVIQSSQVQIPVTLQGTQPVVGTIGRTVIATSEQQQPRYQYSLQTATPVTVQSQSVQQSPRYVVSTQQPTVYRTQAANPTTSQQQVQYLDQSGTSYALVGSQLVPITVNRETIPQIQVQPQVRPQQQQIFYIQQHASGGAKTVVTMPTVPQQTFISTAQPTAIQAQFVQNGTGQHYYTALSGNPTT